MNSFVKLKIKIGNFLRKIANWLSPELFIPAIKPIVYDARDVEKIKAQVEISETAYRNFLFSEKYVYERLAEQLGREILNNRFVEINKFVSEHGDVVFTTDLYIVKRKY